MVERRVLIQLCKALTVDILHLGHLTFWALSCGVSGVVTRVGAGAVRGSSHGRAMGFFLGMSKDRLWGPPNLLFN
jgi:hypothetical protein